MSKESMGAGASGPPGLASPTSISEATTLKVTNAKAHPSPQNPVFRMLGVPNVKLRLPSRNWLIFLGITGSFTGAVLYDRYHRQRATRKWCNAVRHLAMDGLPSNVMPRKITIYLSAPPGDGMRPVREHFYEYIKPILVAGSLDWEVVEGRRPGDVRWAVAERIRRKRRKIEQVDPVALEGEELLQRSLEEQRVRAGTVEYEGLRGDLIVGRHTWKEYIRGIHEGWLGPLRRPIQDDGKPTSEPDIVDVGKEITPTNDGHAHSSIGDAAVALAANTVTSDTDDVQVSADGASAQTVAAATEEKIQLEKEIPKPNNTKPDPYIATNAYETADLTRGMPESLDPVTILPLPHILGFLNTPTRVFRFLTRRHLADNIGRQTAALVLAVQTRPLISDTSSNDMAGLSEHESVLSSEEHDWPKKFRQSHDVDGTDENVLLDRMVLDPRITSRMTVWELSSHDLQRIQDSELSTVS